MRSRLLLAVCLAVLLVGGAAWKRLESKEISPAGNLVAVSDTANTDATSTIDAADSTADLNATGSDATSSVRLTDTDVVSRQLFSDYVNLEANGQATQDNLNALGDEYAASVVSNSQAQVMYMNDLNMVNDSKVNIQAYGDALSKIYALYSPQLITVSKANTDPNDFGPSTISFAQKVSAIYQEEADALRVVPVPDSFAADDLKLVNFYLTSAWNMLSISNTNTDPADAYAAIASETNLDGQEQTILTSIEQRLVSDGIILNNS